MAAKTLGSVPASLAPAAPAAADDYLALVRAFRLRPIRDQADLDAAMAVLGKLAVRDEGTLTPGEQDYLDTLSTLVAQYDDANPDPMPPVAPLDLLRACMDARDMNVSDLGAVLKSKGTASAILSGKRGLSLTHVRRLAAHFRVDPGVFIDMRVRAKGRTASRSAVASRRVVRGGRPRPPAIDVEPVDRRPGRAARR